MREDVDDFVCGVVLEEVTITVDESVTINVTVVETPLAECVSERLRDAEGATVGDTLCRVWEPPNVNVQVVEQHGVADTDEVGVVVLVTVVL